MEVKIIDPSTDKKLSINIKLEEQKPKVIGRYEKLDKGLNEKQYEFWAFLDYADSSAKIKSPHFFVELISSSTEL